MSKSATLTTEVAESAGLLDEAGIMRNRQVVRSGESLYVNVTKLGEEIVGLSEGDEVQVVIRNDCLVIKPTEE